MSYTVGRLARLTGLTVRALHHYDAIGLLSPSQRSASGYRLYAPEDAARLFRIQALQHLGLSLAEIERVLVREGAALPELLEQQLAAVELEIEHATALRTRLRSLQEIMLRGAEPQAQDWLAAVELITHYGKHCSQAELAHLLEHGKTGSGAWQGFAADLSRAVERGLSPTSSEARRLLERWRALLLQWVGGDPVLAIKMKRAYADDASMRSRVELQGGISPQMMAYLGEVMVHLHRDLWSGHLPAQALGRLRVSGRWQHDLLPTVAAVREAAAGEGGDEAVGHAVTRWRGLVWEFADEDQALARVVVATLLAAEVDPELTALWFLPEELRQWLRLNDLAWTDPLERTTDHPSHDRLQ